MMKNNINIRIPNPCKASWDSMSPEKNGKFCMLCNKTVVDFSKMSVEEIKCYFNTQAGKKTCGFFYKNQLENNHTLFQENLLTKYRRANHTIQNSITRAISLFILGLMLSLSGCNSHRDDEHKVGEMEPIRDTTFKPIDTTKTR